MSLRPPAQEKRLQFAFALHVNTSAWLQREEISKVAGCILGHMDSIGQRIGLEPAGDIYCIAPHVVDEAVRADDAGNHRTGMYADPDFQGPAEMAVDAAQSVDYAERHFRDRCERIGVRIVQAGDGHVRIADGLDLLDAELACKPVKLQEQPIQVLDYR